MAHEYDGHEHKHDHVMVWLCILVINLASIFVIHPRMERIEACIPQLAKAAQVCHERGEKP